MKQIYGDWVSFEANWKGLRQIVSLRGGVEDLGLQGFPKRTYKYYEHAWARQHAQVQPATQKLRYLDHPFPPETCIIIAKLPEGFHELALSKSLSMEVIQLLKQVPEPAPLSKQPKSDNKVNPATNALEAAK